MCFIGCICFVSPSFAPEMPEMPDLKACLDSPYEHKDDGESATYQERNVVTMADTEKNGHSGISGTLGDCLRYIIVMNRARAMGSV